jgi:hypothetical protein
VPELLPGKEVQLAESPLTQRLFGQILWRIERLAGPLRRVGSNAATLRCTRTASGTRALSN